MSSRKLLIAAVITASASALTAGSASAAGLDQVVAGTASSTISISAGTPAAFASGFTPGTTATSTGGTLTTVSTSPTWSLTAKENGGGADGKLNKASTGCSSSASLASAPSLAVSPLVADGSITPTTITLSGADQEVASATAVPLAATVFSTVYSQPIGASELLQSGCIYSETVSYTLQ